MQFWIVYYLCLDEQFVMNYLLRYEKKKGVGRISSMIPPLLLGVPIPASFLYTPLLKVSSNIPTIVTGLNPPLLFYEGRSVNHHAGDCLHLVYKHAPDLRQPDYTDKATRLQSFKYWGGRVPPLELVDAGFHMIAPRDTVKCYWCGVVIANWRRGESPIDVHCLRRPNCDFVKNYMELLSEVDGNRASCDESKAVGNLYGERLVIKGGVKRGNSLINSVDPSTAQPSSDNISNSPQVVNHLIAGINYPISHQSVTTHGHELKDSGGKSSKGTLDSLPWEEIIFVS